MNIKKAAKQTLLILSDMSHDNNFVDSCRTETLRVVCCKIISGSIKGDALLELGWVQACICMQGYASKDELDIINFVG